MPGNSELLQYVTNPLKRFAVHVLGACRDLAPIILVITFFQLVILRQPFPAAFEVLVGLVLIILGLALFVLGLEIGLFPIGETMAEALTRVDRRSSLLATPTRVSCRTRAFWRLRTIERVGLIRASLPHSVVVCERLLPHCLRTDIILRKQLPQGKCPRHFSRVFKGQRHLPCAFPRAASEQTKRTTASVVPQATHSDDCYEGLRP